MLLALLVGCDAPDGSTPVPTPAPVPCAAGEIDDAGTCVPERCGVGPWGDVVADVYADGSVPLETLVAEHPGAHIALAAGSWDTHLWLERADGGLVLEGRCRELVELAGGDQEPAIALDAAVTVTLRELRVTGGANGLQVTRGELVAEAVDVVGAHNFGVIAVGEGASVRLADSSVTDTHPVDGHFGRGIDVEAGASLVADRVAVARNTDVSVFLVDGVSASLTEVAITDSLPASARVGGRGLELGEGSVLTATGLAVSGATDVGLFLYGTGTAATIAGLSVTGTTLTDPATGGVGTQITSGSSLTLTDPLFAENEGAGLVVDGEGTTAVVEGGTFDHNRATSRQDPGGGIMAQNGAVAEVRDSRFTDNSDVALGVVDGAVLTVEDVQVHGTRLGPTGHGGEALYADGGTLVAARVEVDDGQEHAVYARRDATLDLYALDVDGTWTTDASSYGRGMNLQEGAQLRCEGCRIAESHDVAVIADGATTRVELVDTELTGSHANADTRGAMGVTVQSWAEVRGERLTVTGAEGPGVYVVVGGSFVCAGCTVVENGFAGVVLLDGAVEMSDSTIDGAHGDASAGGGVGVYANAAYGDTTLTLTRVTATGNRYAAVWLEGSGAYRIVDSHLEGGTGVVFGTVTAHGNAVFARDGVTPWDGTFGLALEGTTLADSRTAVLLHGASASLDGAVFTDNGVDLSQQACASSTPPTGVPESAEVVSCPEWWQIVVPLSYALYLEDVSVDE